MEQIEKTVFISYRRTNLPWALAIYQDLTYHGYNVFFDFESIKSGDFEQTIMQNIKGRAHFVIILTPSALERCDEPEDWLRREIELALDEKRNIIPLMLEGFTFSSPSISKYLTGKMALLKKYNGLNVPADYFEEAMTRLRDDRLNVPLDAVLHPISNTVQSAVKKQQVAAGKAKNVQQKELSAQEWFEQGYKHLQAKKLDDAIHSNSEAIALKPDFTLAYINRAAARVDKMDIDGGIQDCNAAIRLDPTLYNPFYIRGLAYKAKGDLDQAIKDYTESIRLNPNFASSYLNRSQAYFQKGLWDNTIEDASKAISLDPAQAMAYNNRGIARKNKGDIEGALKDYNESIRLKPDFAMAYNNRGITRNEKGDQNGAIKDYSEAIRLDPDYADAYINRSSIHYNQGLWDKTIEDATKAININQTDPAPFNNRGAARLNKGELDEAIKDFTEAIRINPNFAIAYGGRGDVWWNKKDYYLVIADYQKYIDLGGGNTEVVKQRIREAKKKIGK